MQNLHFFCKVPVLLAKTGRFRCIRLLPPPGFSRAERFDLKPPGLQLRAGDTRLPGNAALCRARFTKPLNRCCLILVRILPSMVSRLVPLSWTGVRYPGVRKQGRSSIYGYIQRSAVYASWTTRFVLRPKNRGPDQLVPVIFLAMAVSDAYSLPSILKPCSRTLT